jgi:hypothetical protein
MTFDPSFLGMLTQSLFGNFTSNKIARTEVAGLIVSTVETSDEGCETAVIDENHANPVERYSSKEEAMIGHEKWVKHVTDPNCTTITKLGPARGHGVGIVLDEEIVLVRKKTEDE